MYLLKTITVKTKYFCVWVIFFYFAEVRVIYYWPNKCTFLKVKEKKIYKQVYRTVLSILGFYRKVNITCLCCYGTFNQVCEIYARQDLVVCY